MQLNENSTIETPSTPEAPVAVMEATRIYFDGDSIEVRDDEDLPERPGL